MQTHLSDDANGSELGVGAQFDPMELRPGDIIDSGYLLVSEPEQGKFISLLEVWECPHCGSHENWALITIKDRKVIEIKAVILDQAALKSAHFISEVYAEFLAISLLGKSITDEDIVETLRRLLP